jgi:hypothetical protein
MNYQIRRKSWSSANVAEVVFSTKITRVDIGAPPGDPVFRVFGLFQENNQIFFQYFSYFNTNGLLPGLCPIWAVADAGFPPRCGSTEPKPRRKTKKENHELDHHWVPVTS